MEGIYMGLPVYFPPCMTTPDQERQRLQRLPLHCVIEELIATKARLEVEKSATMKCFEVIHQDRMRHVRMQATTCAWFGFLKNSGNMCAFKRCSAQHKRL